MCENNGYLIFLKNYLFWLHWVSVGCMSFSLVVESVGYSLRWLLLLLSTSSRVTGFSSCDLRAQFLQLPVFDPRVRKISWKRKWQPTPVFLPGKSMEKAAQRAIIYGVTRMKHDLAAKPPLPDIPWFQHHLLKRLFFLLLNYLGTLLKMHCPYTCASIPVFCSVDIPMPHYHNYSSFIPKS